MNYKVVYFTRTETSRRVANKIAKGLSCEAIEVTDNMNWKGIFGFIKGGYYASKKKPVEINLSSELGSYDEIIIVSPLWAGGVVPAINTFLKNVSQDKVNLVLTSNGSTSNDRSNYKSITDIVKNNKNEDILIKELIDRLLK